jgi:hypothetical protein
MITFKRYPHVKDLIIHYATTLDADDVLKMMDAGISDPQEAETFAKFIWRMVDQMAIDNENNTTVLGQTDNSDMMPDLDYEISLYFSNSGYEEIWEKSFDE